MNIFRKKSKNLNNASCCAHAECASVKMTAQPCKSQKDGAEILTIKVLGSGCKNCRALLDNVNEAVSKGSLNANVEYITDMKLIAGYGVMSMPALIINEKVASTGKVLKAEDIISLVGKI